MSNSESNPPRIGVLSCPMDKANIQPFVNLVCVLRQINSKIAVIAVHDEFSSISGFQNDDFSNISEIIHHSGSTTFLSRIGFYFLTQVRISVRLLLSPRGDAWIFYLDGGLILPMVTAKLLRRDTLIVLGGSQEREVRLKGSKIGRVAYALARINLRLCNSIIVYSPKLITEWNLEPYRHKILIAHRHFLDFETFTITTPLSDRPHLIGYIGRLSGEKGVQHFVQALPAILNDQQDLRAFIGGDGPLKEAVEASLQEQGVSARVDLPGWIPHDNLPRYLNQLRLLILPSYTEGLPNIMIEAMACGTPVLATPVGAIPDVIIDGKTGFIMENNSPECIAENVIRALSSPDLEQIAEEGRRFVEENYTFERVVERWKEVLEEI
jgi:glycosyltransferase involved in cell wall biosynthesis